MCVKFRPEGTPKPRAHSAESLAAAPIAPMSSAAGTARMSVAEDATFVCVTLSSSGAGPLSAVGLEAESCAVTAGR